MKLIISAAATLSLADGSKYTLSPGIHDSSDFPDAVKQHWAFNSYVRQVDDSEVEQPGESDELTERVETLNALVDEQKSNIAALTAQLADRDSKIVSLQANVDTLTKQQAATTAPANEPDSSTDSTSKSDSKNAKKQQAAK